jgi:hypothetical protein
MISISVHRDTFVGCVVAVLLPPPNMDFITPGRMVKRGYPAKPDLAASFYF